MKQLSGYIKTKISNKNINLVKDFLIKYFNVNSWEEYVDSLENGDCRKVCDLIRKKFPNLFDKMLDNIFIDYSEIAQRKIHDNGEMYGNHYVLTKGGQIYDFARGANCINGIYVLTQREDNLDKYDILFTDYEKNLIYNEIKHL